ncbi:MAG: AAA family ATPase, partial [Nanoarchaeota archaeon]
MTEQTTLCDKYKPECFADVKGQEQAIEKVKIFFKNFPKKKALILQGATGTGKPSLAYALASETNSEILELNASDLRNREQISKIIGEAIKQKSLFSKSKILLVDEIDGITKDDRGGLPELISLIQETSFPIILTSNDIWDRKFSDLRRKAELVQLEELDYKIILEILKKIAGKENIKLDENILKSIAIKAGGDARAALNDLQTITLETGQEDIGERDKEESIFNALKQVLKGLPNHETLYLYDRVALSLDEIFL